MSLLTSTSIREPTDQYEHPLLAAAGAAHAEEAGDEHEDAEDEEDDAHRAQDARQVERLTRIVFLLHRQTGAAENRKIRKI